MYRVILSFIIFWSVAGVAADCGIKPQGMEFGPNCELIRVPSAPAKKSVNIGNAADLPAPRVLKDSDSSSSGRKRGWQTIQLGAYAGKPGYYAMIGAGQDLKVDALLMNEEVMEKALKATESLKLGGLVSCEAVGMQQSTGYTLFDLRNCGSGK